MTHSLSRSGACEATLEEHTNGVSALAVLPDGRLVSGSLNQTITLWNAHSGACEATLEEHTSWVGALAVLPDGRLASGSDAGTIKLWNLREDFGVAFVSDAPISCIAIHRTASNSLSV